MKMLFIDESYNLKCDIPFFALGGVVIPEELWKHANDKLKEIRTNNKINGEIKWTWIFSRKLSTPLSHLSLEHRLDLVVKPILEFIRDNKLQLFTTLTHINDFKTEFIKSTNIQPTALDFQKQFEIFYYHKNYENIVQRFQYYLQDCQAISENSKGIIICDHRTKSEDEALRKLHLEMLQGAKGKITINYKNLIEHLLLAPSHLSVGIQFADIVSGIILSRLRRFKEAESLFQIIKDSFNAKSGDSHPNGRGVVKIPKSSIFWKKER